MGEKLYSAKDVIFRENEAGSEAYLIKSGKVEILKQTAQGTVVLYVLGAGAAFGENGLLDERVTRPYSAQAVEDTELEAIQPDGFRALLGQAKPELIALIGAIFNRTNVSAKPVTPKEASPEVLHLDVQTIEILPVDGMSFPPRKVPLDSLPFVIGGRQRESKEATALQNIQLQVPCEGPPLAISKYHCEIALENGALYVVDLGSRFCTVVNGTEIGRGRGQFKIPLQKGKNEVRLGGKDAPYALEVVL